MLLNPHLHEDLDSDASQSIRARIHADNFREVFSVDRRGLFGIGHGNEKAKADFVARFTGLEINATARNAERAAQVFKMFFFRIRGTNAHQLRDFAAAEAAAFRRSCASRGECVAGSLAHQVLRCHG